MMKILSLLFILLFSLVPGFGWANTFYVAQTSAGDESGSSYDNRASVSIHNAGSGNFADLDGDTVYLSDTITSQVTPPDSGSSGNVVTYRGDYAGHACTFSGGANGFYAIGVDYITVKGITFTNQSYTAIWINDCDYWTIQDCIFSSNSNKYGILLKTNSGGGGVSNITIQDCDFTDFYNSIRIQVAGSSYSTSDRHSDITIDGCTFDSPSSSAIDEYYGTSDTDKRNWANNDRMPGNMTYTDNVITNTGNCAIVACWTWGTNLIARNRCTNIGDGGAQTNAFQLSMCHGTLIVEDNYIDTTSAEPNKGDGQSIILDHAMRGVWGINENWCIGTIVRRNFCTNATTQKNACGINMYDAKDCEIYNNIFVGNNIGITGKGRTYNTGNKIYNNVIVGNNSHGVKLWDEFVSQTWRNNIIANNGGYAFYLESGSVSQDETYTLYYNNSSGFSNSDSADATDINSNPLFTDAAHDDYSLLINSPAINAGTTITDDPAMSYGLSSDTNWSASPPSVVTLVQGDHGTEWDIGAYVSSNSSGELKPPQSLKQLK